MKRVWVLLRTLTSRWLKPGYNFLLWTIFPFRIFWVDLQVVTLQISSQWCWMIKSWLEFYSSWFSWWQRSAIITVLFFPFQDTVSFGLFLAVFTWEINITFGRFSFSFIPWRFYSPVDSVSSWGSSFTPLNCILTLHAYTWFHWWENRSWMIKRSFAVTEKISFQ